METEIFEIKIKEYGKKFIQKTYFWVKFFYICTLITCLFDLVNAGIGLKYFLKMSKEYSSFFNFYQLTNLIFLVIYAFLLPTMAFFLYRFMKGAKKAIQFQNEDEFNLSFRWLFRHGAIASVLFILNTIWAILITISELKYLNTITT